MPRNYIYSIHFVMMFYFLGLIFVSQGGPFAISSPFWGYLCDEGINGKAIVIIGVFLTSVAFLFIGPVCFLPLDTSISVCIAMLIIQGIGVAAQLVSGLSVSHKAGILTQLYIFERFQ